MKYTLVLFRRCFRQNEWVLRLSGTANITRWSYQGLVGGQKSSIVRRNLCDHREMTVTNVTSSDGKWRVLLITQCAPFVDFNVSFVDNCCYYIGFDIDFTLA